MATTVSRPDAYRAYKREIAEALEMGAAREDIAVVVDAFLGERVDLDEFRSALQQYVDPDRLAELEEDAAHRRRRRGEPVACPTCGHYRVVECRRRVCPHGRAWPNVEDAS